MTQEVKEWLDMADMDLGVARHLEAHYYPKPLEIICYHSQQAAEKAVKALIIHCGMPSGVPKVHSITALMRQIKNEVFIDEKFFDYGDVLTPYGVIIRYPNELMIEEHHAKTAIQYAGEILEWVKGLVDGDESGEEDGADSSEKKLGERPL